MKRSCGGRTTPQAMGSCIKRSGSIGFVNLVLTSPRMKGQTHCRRSPLPVAAAALAVRRNDAKPPQHSSAGVGIAGVSVVSFPDSMNRAQVYSGASAMTQASSLMPAPPLLPPPLPGTGTGQPASVSGSGSGSGRCTCWAGRLVGEEGAQPAPAAAEPGCTHPHSPSGNPPVQRSHCTWGEMVVVAVAGAEG